MMILAQVDHLLVELQVTNIYRFNVQRDYYYHHIHERQKRFRKRCDNGSKVEVVWGEILNLPLQTTKIEEGGHEPRDATSL